MSKKSLIEKNLNNFEPLCKYYASKVFNYSRFGLEKDDIIQEMRIKTYMAIVGFARQWEEYRKNASHKPAPLEYWVRTSLSNKVKDFIRTFNQENISNVDKISIGSGEETIDIGEYKTSDFILDENRGIAILNGVNLVEKLKGERKTIYINYMIGYTISELSKKHPKIDVEGLINRHNQYLRDNNANELLEYRSEMLQTYQQSEE